MRSRLAALALTLPFRMVVAVAILSVHLAMATHLGHERFGYHFNDAPDSAPQFHQPAREPAPQHWERLVVSRWDSQHYIALGLRGYKACKSKSELLPGEHPDDNWACELNFYPTYGFLGAAVVAVSHLPMDYALFGISLAAGFVFILMWTGKAMVDGLGVANSYLSLLLLNVFSTGYGLVTLQTDCLFMALTLGTFVCLRKQWLAMGALTAGAATAIRISGVATGFAFCAWIVTVTWREGARPSRVWAWRGLLMALSGSGIMALMGYYAWRFGDPLIYSHAHGRSYHHAPDLMRIFVPDGRLLIQSIWAEPNEGLALVATLLWFALGHRAGLARFSAEAQAFWYALYFGIVGISMIGSSEYAYGGFSRYAVTVLPLFFAMAGVLRRKPVALALWLVMSSMHYYNGSLCFYVGQLHPERLQRCGFARYFRSDELSR